MAPVVILLLLVAVDCLVASGRIQAFPVAQQRWKRSRKAVLAYIRSAPATYVYLFVLLITSWALQTSSSRVANRLLLEQSTNLHQLGRDPVHVLLASVFWLENGHQFLFWLALLTAVMAPFERRAGSARTIVVFAAGHVLATLLTAAGLWAALRLDAVEHSVVNARDVGASYGFLAVAGCLTYLMAGPLRVPYAVGLTAVVVILVAVSHDFTAFGHLFSLGIGFTCRPLVASVASSDPAYDAVARRLASHRRRTSVARMLTRSFARDRGS